MSVTVCNKAQGCRVSTAACRVRGLSLIVVYTKKQTEEKLYVEPAGHGHPGVYVRNS